MATGILTGTYHKPDGTPWRGTVHIYPSVPVVRDETGNVIMAGSVAVTLDGTGSHSTPLAASDDLTLDPSGVTYRVSLRGLPPVEGVFIPAGGTVDMADVTTVDPDAPVTDSQFQVAAGLVASEAVTARAAELALRNLSDSTFATTLAASYGQVIGLNPTMSAAAINTRLAAANAGDRAFFTPGTYALGGTSLVIPVDDMHIDALGATFTLNTWGKPAFDALDVDGCTYDIGLVQYIGTRGNHTGTSVRGNAPYAYGAGVWTNGDRHHVRTLRTIGMPTAVHISSWGGTSQNDRTGQGNRVGRLECQTYDFGVLWESQRGLVIDDIYAHDDIDDSGGVNPTHAYYCSAITTMRSTGVQILKARAENNLGGQAFQLKFCDQTQLGPHSADNSLGLINVTDCDDLSWTDMKGTNLVVGSGPTRAVTLQTSTANCQRPALKNTFIHYAANQDVGGCFAVVADDAEVDGLTVIANHSSGVNTGFVESYIVGARPRVKGVRLRSVGAGHVKGFSVGFGAAVATSAKIRDIQVDGERSVVEVAAGSTLTGIDYDPTAQALTGGGAHVVGAVADYYFLRAPGSIAQQVFTANGTYTVPAGAKTITAILLGGGGGGGSGRRGAAASVRCGGGGGAGAARTVAVIPASALPATVAVVVGAAGPGGAAVTANDTNGNNGTAGGSTTFSTYARAWGGAAGGGGTAAAGTAGAAQVGGTEAGGAGGAATGGVGGGGGSGVAAGGGAAAGGISAGDAASIGGAGGLSWSGQSANAAAGAVDGTSPSAGAAQPANSGRPGNGGAGGSASITTAAQDGAAGGIYGGGGGGGGASLNGNNSGKGGDGAAGVVVVIAQF